jgi:phosphoribosylaminoimidazolecarboxamide formyltransferase/IMP cyclohydrolase
MDHVRVSRALLSVSDKTGLIPFAKTLAAHGVDLISTGGTAKALREAGLKVRDVADITGFPEMMDGRVKTLHPKVHGGLLALRENPEHVAAMKEHSIEPIDMLVVNLYPFEDTIEKTDDYHTLVENIDIGGPAMIRAAAKNQSGVAVVTDPADYEALEAELNAHSGALSFATRQQLSAKAYARTAAYDAAISNWMLKASGVETPRARAFGGRLKQELRYGENPHQKAALYLTSEQRPGVARATLHQGKELSYNNINDTDAAFELISEFGTDTPAVVIVKHANPCGVATANTMIEAYKLALRCDPVSAFGGIIALNQTLDAATAEEITKLFTEVIIAPEVTDEAAAIIKAKKNLRLLTTGGLADPRAAGMKVKAVAGGLLVQERDRIVADDIAFKVVTKRAPTEEELRNLRFAFRVAKHVKSNTIVYAKDGATVGVGAGQMSRVDAARIAAHKAKEAAEAAGLSEPLTVGSAAASDAFFPFADGLLSVIEAGATAVVQPGGSMRDQEVIDAANERGVAMVFTGVRHFRH